MARAPRRDVNGLPLKRGDRVRYLGVPARLVASLPMADQRAIGRRVGLLHRIEGFDAQGHAELELPDRPNGLKTIWVPGNRLERAANTPKRRAKRLLGRQARARLRK